MTPKEKRSTLLEEIVQRTDEGCDTIGWRERVLAAGDWDLDDLYQELMALRMDPIGAAREPSVLVEIQALRPDGDRRITNTPTGDALYDRILGAWQGRCAGCLLGKPVEGWHPDAIRGALQATGGWELDNYFTPEAIRHRRPNAGSSEINCTVGNINMMERDDDTDYTIFGLHIMERHGIRFSPDHVIDGWLLRLPYYETFTAERAAYRNRIDGMDVPATAVYWNPYREWIGAQIRADFWGYAAPGWPERAAEMAFTDACISHTRNGIYGEMWVAAMIAGAFTTSDIRKVIEIGLSEIPEECRLAQMIRQVVEWRDDTEDWQECSKRIMAATTGMDSVHTINNAAIVAMGLLYGGGDFERSIAIGVMGGLDTDCNGATVGSIVGTMLGAKAMPGKWIDPLNDTIRSSVSGFDGSKITDLAMRTLAQAEKVLAQG